jgi:hypothetical protein
MMLLLGYTRRDTVDKFDGNFCQEDKEQAYIQYIG